MPELLIDMANCLEIRKDGVSLNGFAVAGCAWRKPCLINYAAKPSGVSVFQLKRVSSESNCQSFGVEETFNIDIAGDVNAYYGDQIYAVATPETGYNAPSLSGVSTSASNPTIVTGGLSVTITPGSVATYTLSYNTRPVGISSRYIYIKHEGVGDWQLLASNPSSLGSVGVTYGDQVYATATAATGYSTPSVSGISTNANSPTTVTKNISATFTAGERLSYTVTFDLAGGTRTGGGELVQTIYYGEDATPPTCTFDGHTFESWSGSYTGVTSNRTITATWITNKVNNSINTAWYGEAQMGIRAYSAYAVTTTVVLSLTVHFTDSSTAAANITISSGNTAGIWLSPDKTISSWTVGGVNPSEDSNYYYIV